MNYHILWLKVDKIKRLYLEKNNVLEVGIGKNGPGILVVIKTFAAQS
jgi:hypothetical protein